MIEAHKTSIKWNRWRFLSAFVGIILFLSSGCNRSGGTSNGATSPMIFNQPGTYVLNPSGYKLVLSVNPDAIVEFQVIDPKISGVVLFSGDAGSNYSRWFLYWSSKEELWIYSGDIGVFVWYSSNGQKYLKTTVVNNDVNIIRQIPHPFFNALPKSLQHKWSQARNRVP